MDKAETELFSTFFISLQSTIFEFSHRIDLFFRDDNLASIPFHLSTTSEFISACH